MLHGEHRVVFEAKITRRVGTIEVLCGGPRRSNAVYTAASELVASGRLTDSEVSDLWLALGTLEIVAEQVGLDGWDFAPEPAPVGLQRAAVAAGLLAADIAAVLSKDETQAALVSGWGSNGPDPDLAIQAALRRARSSGPIGNAETFADRLAPRCRELMPRAKRACVRRHGHSGPHRSS